MSKERCTGFGLPVFSTPMARVMGELLGYSRYQGVGLTKNEVNALEEVYGFDLDSEIDPDGPVSQAGRFHCAGSYRNLMRYVEQDGLRVMAFLGKFLEKDEDPVQLVAKGLAALGFDAPIEDEYEIEDDDGDPDYDG